MIARLIRSAVEISLVSLCLCAGTALGQAAAGTTLSTDDEVARGLFQAGSAAYDAGRYEEALGFFEQAYEQSGRAELLFNVGQTADRLRQDERALTAFKAFLQQMPGASNRAQVESRIAALERAQAARNASATVAPSPAAEAPAAPTPAEAAATTTSAAPDDAGDDPFTQADDEPALAERWWFWTGVGAVVLGGAALAIVIAAGGDDAGQAASYQGNGGSLRGP